MMDGWFDLVTNAWPLLLVWTCMVLFLAGSLVSGLIWFIGFMRLARKLNRRKYEPLHEYAERNGWERGEERGLPAIFGRTPTGHPWKLYVALGSESDPDELHWQAQVNTGRDHLFLVHKGSRGLSTTWFSNLTRFELGPSELQRRYFLAANDERLLQQLLTDDVVTRLMAWPEMRRIFMKLFLTVRLKRNKLLICFDGEPDETRVRVVVALGEALLAAYGGSPNVDPIASESRLNP